MLDTYYKITVCKKEMLNAPLSTMTKEIKRNYKAAIILLQIKSK